MRPDGDHIAGVRPPARVQAGLRGHHAAPDAARPGRRHREGVRQADRRRIQGGRPLPLQPPTLSACKGIQKGEEVLRIQPVTFGEVAGRPVAEVGLDHERVDSRFGSLRGRDPDCSRSCLQVRQKPEDNLRNQTYNFFSPPDLSVGKCC